MDTQKRLRPYQEDDVKFLCRYPTAGCFNEQRTGKTPTALMCIKERGLENKRILIIATSSALYTWQKEYTDWLNKPCIVVDGTPTQKRNAIQQWTHGLIISLGSLKATQTSDGYLKEILNQKPEMVILDEAHQIRNYKTCNAKAVFKLLHIPYRLALTGTPAYGEPKDIYSILHFLYPDLYKTPYNFYTEYFIPEQLHIYVSGSLRAITEYKTFRPDKEKRLQTFLNEHCTQRKRKEVMQWLPKKDKQLITLPKTKEQTKYLKELKDTFETEEVVTSGILDRLVRYRQICLAPELLNLKGTSPKTEWILDFISENPDTPLIIFSNFTQYLQNLFNVLKSKHIKEAMIVGAVPPKLRMQYQNDFQAGKFNVFLINIAAGKEALTLDRAEAIIFTDVYPPIGGIEQAEDRFVATTKDKANKPHTIYNLVMQDSFDETITDLLNQRKTETEVINNFKALINKKEV